MFSIFVMAAGNQLRWEGEQGLKQLLQINGEMLIYRTCMQFERKFSTKPVVITHMPDQFPNLTTQVPTSRECVCDSILNTVRGWKGTVIILLGDVYYTDDAARKIYDDDSVFFGCKEEMYALKITEENRSRVIDCAMQAVVYQHRIGGDKGKLWQLYRAWEGFPLDGKHVLGNSMNYITDKTQDFDKYEDYLKFIGG